MKNKKGFTLIELIVVIAILGILALFLVPSFLGYTKDAQKATCEANRHIIERSYTFYKAKSVEEITLNEYINSDNGKEYQGSKCPAGGVYTYDDANGKVICSIHGEDEDKNEGTGEESGDGDKSEDSDPEESTTPKIPGTELDVNYENVISVVKGENIGQVGKGQIIELKDNENNILGYYIVKYPTHIGSFSGQTSSGDLLELTKDPAINVFGTGSNAIKDALGDRRSIGTKILYNGKYYISIEKLDENPQIPGNGTHWVEIK
ncbi:competence type IV pilus major pilin ComGC [Dielma fastidiosa]|uniref:competence type IV pilus major pilin ComGC n=1 Tax=Dielma fastidiosa TaxID=1034346 RepID=UPI003567F297